ncbi:hypothetical protein ACFL3C_05205 [Patescibacteria group bacterium]
MNNTNKTIEWEIKGEAGNSTAESVPEAGVWPEIAEIRGGASNAINTRLYITYAEPAIYANVLDADNDNLVDQDRTRQLWDDVHERILKETQGNDDMQRLLLLNFHFGRVNRVQRLPIVKEVNGQTLSLYPVGKGPIGSVIYLGILNGKHYRYTLSIENPRDDESVEEITSELFSEEINYYAYDRMTGSASPADKGLIYREEEEAA